MSETDINAPATRRNMDVPTIRTMPEDTWYVCRVWAIVAGQNVWHTWHDRIGLDQLMRGVCDTYAHRLNTVVMSMTTAYIVPLTPGSSVHMLYINGRLLRDENDAMLVFASPGAAEAEVERVCRARL